MLANNNLKNCPDSFRCMPTPSRKLWTLCKPTSAGRQPLRKSKGVWCRKKKMEQEKGGRRSMFLSIPSMRVDATKAMLVSWCSFVHFPFVTWSATLQPARKRIHTSRDWDFGFWLAGLLLSCQVCAPTLLQSIIWNVQFSVFCIPFPPIIQ